MPNPILDELDQRLYAGQRTDFDQAWLQHYLGTPRLILGWKNDQLRAVAKETYKAHKQLPTKTWLDIMDALYAQPVFEHRLLASFLLHANKPLH